MKISPQRLVKFNLICTAVWVILIIPTLIWWKESILWVGLMSIWANVVGHFGAYIAARAEVESATNPNPNKPTLTDEDKKWIQAQLNLATDISPPAVSTDDTAIVVHHP